MGLCAFRVYLGLRCGQNAKAGTEMKSMCNVKVLNCSSSFVSGLATEKRLGLKGLGVEGVRVLGLRG